MKYLLVLCIVLLGIWLWRTNREADPKRNKQQTKAAPKPLEMVRCTLCSVHIPSTQAIQGKKGAYCSADHLHLAEH